MAPRGFPVNFQLILLNLRSLIVGYTKLLVIGGLKDYSSEVLDLDSDVIRTCEKPIDVPHALQGAAGGLLHGSVPMFCGGHDGGNQCECRAHKNGAWAEVAKLKTCQSFAGSATLTSASGQDKLFMVGGAKERRGDLRSVQMFDGETVKSLSDLPIPVSENCLVVVNDTTLIAIGGNSDLNWVSSTFFYDIPNDAWTPGPELATPSGDHSCGIFSWNNPSSGELERIVVVAGGLNNAGPLSKVELLLLTPAGFSAGWQPGPELPKKIFSAAMVQFRESVVLVGGEGETFGRDLYQLTSPGGSWTRLNQTLSAPRSRHVAIMIPDELTSCCQGQKSTGYY